jgi:hypothetical protein
MGIGDQEADTGEPAGNEASQKRRSARAVLGGVQVKAQDLPSS